MNEYQGKLIAPAKAKFAIVVSRFNEFITSRLLSGAIDALSRHGVADDDIDVIWSPGSFEIPVITARIAESGQYAAVLCLGAVIRGCTEHYQYIA
ncbi:MAG: 6,7-dimethyl-8-ribityllumazine synthase, partial [Candidatus Hydrogenedentes bacterium]|nr:6,7-dimethyl-8-ribityllumazine synthase [Candidatus Hydrogenedentota bacterium]